MTAPSHEEIARRAYEISQRGEGGSDEDNWHRAERELREEQGGGEGPWAKIGSGDTESMTSDGEQETKPRVRRKNADAD